MTEHSEANLSERQSAVNIFGGEFIYDFGKDAGGESYLQHDHHAYPYACHPSNCLEQYA
jgi:hypothetical protein